MHDYKQKIYRHYYTKRVGKNSPSDLGQLASREPFYRNIIDNFFPADKSSQVLDLGCGLGAFVYFMHSAGFENARGVDTSFEMTEIANDLGISNIEQGNVFDYLKKLPDDSMDVVTAIDLFEHFGKSELFDLVTEIYRVLKNGGVLISHQPNAEGIFGGGIRYGDYTHEQAFTRVSIAQVLLTCGFGEVTSYEDKPIPHGLKSWVRFCIWQVFIRPLYKFLVSVEAGGVDKDIIFTKNFLSLSVK